jgi:chromosome segregation ATPase
VALRKCLLGLAIFPLTASLVAASELQPPRVFLQSPSTAAEKRVWTEEDLIALRAISPVMDSGLRPSGEASRAGEASKRYTKFRDPRWYREQLEPLRAELERTSAEIRKLRSMLKSGKGGTNRIDFDQETEGVTTEWEVTLLVNRRAAILKQIDALEDLAQKNEVLPGELRKERSADELAYSTYQEEVANLTPEPEKLESEAQWRKRFAELHEQLEYAQRELSVLQREWSVSLNQYYPNPMKAMREQFTRREIDALAKKIRDKKAEIAQLKQTISDLEDDLRHSGGPPGWARE